LNQKVWGGKTVYVDFAKERAQPRDENKVFAMPSASVYVSNLPSDCDKAMLMLLFSRFGTIIDARPLKTDSGGNSRGIAFIDFALQESAAAAIDALDSTMQHGKTIKVTYAANPSKRKGDTQPLQPDSKRFKGDPAQASYTVPMYFDPNFNQYAFANNVVDQNQWYPNQSYQF